jgi:hypothetical protein
MGIQPDLRVEPSFVEPERGTVDVGEAGVNVVAGYVLLLCVKGRKYYEGEERCSHWRRSFQGGLPVPELTGVRQCTRFPPNLSSMAYLMKRLLKAA